MSVEAGPRTLDTLAAALGSAITPSERDGPIPRISRIVTRSGDATAGALFVAIRGTETDGHAFLEEAVRNGAAAAVVETGYRGDPGVPTVRVPDARRAVAELAAEWYGHPARGLRMVGITGSLGKTSTLAMVEAVLAEAGISAGSVGSLGVHVDGETIRTSGHTAPDPLFLHRELARLVDEGCDTVAMEVTSHALVQERVHGLRYDLGMFTNMVPLEHSEYHPTFRDYVAAKARFFAYLRPDAPFVYNHDDLVVRQLVRDSEVTPIGCGIGADADVAIEGTVMDAAGSSFDLVLRRPLPRADGGAVPRTRLSLGLQLLGHTNVSNAALAAAAGLALGATPAQVERALGGLAPQPRRMEVVHEGAFTVIDDTVGHPDSISAVLRVAREFEPRRVHVVFAVRGQRGARVNHHSATTLAVWARQIPLGTLVLTSSEEAADERNAVEAAEREACERALRDHGVAFAVERRLDQGVRAVLEAAGDGDLVLLLGAQGMDAGREVVRSWLRETGAIATG